MVPDGVRTSSRYSTTSPFHARTNGRETSNMTSAYFHDDEADRPRVTHHYRHQQPQQYQQPQQHQQHQQFQRQPQQPQHQQQRQYHHEQQQQQQYPQQQRAREPEPEPTTRQRRATRSANAPSSAPGSSSGVFRGRDFFHCPELDQRMKKYLVRLANETANHLIRDTLEPEHTNLVWKPMTSIKGIDILRGFEQAPTLSANTNANAGQANDANANASANANANVVAKDTTCLRGVAQVNASIEEFAMLFKLDTNKHLAEHGLLFNPDLMDMATLYSLVQPSGDHPRRYVGIKWCLVQSPSRFFRNRDFCYLECQKEFRDASGRRGWVRSMHSIKMPCCPTLEKSHGIVRASLYRCGLIAVETDRPGVLDTTYTIEMDLKGHFPEIFQPKFLSQRIAALASIDKYLQQQRLSSSPLLGDLDIPKTKNKGTCHHCFREFATFTKRFVCRKCGEGVCKNCGDDWELDIPVIGRKKVRICTVCSAEARACHATPRHVVGAAGAGTQGQQQYYDPRQPVRIRRSNSEPGSYDYGHGPFVHTAREPTRSALRTPTDSMSSRATDQMDPSEYFARQHQQLQQQHQLQQQAARESQAHYRESDFTTDIRDLAHGGIRGTADLTNLWTEQDADRYGSSLDNHNQLYQPQPENVRARRGTLQQPQPRESSTVPRAGVTFTQSTRSRAPTATSEQSSGYSDRDGASSGRAGHIPPSARYTVVGNRLERANSFDAGRHLEEQHHRQQRYTHQPQGVSSQIQHQRQYQHHQIHEPQHQHQPYHGNSRRSQQPLNDVYSPQQGGLYLSPSRSNRTQGQDSPSSPAQSSQEYPHHQQRQSSSRQPSRQQTAAPSEMHWNVAADFARQERAPASTQRNVALEFARQPHAQPTAPVPRNIALEFARQAPSPAAAPRNVALEFLKQQQAPAARHTPTKSVTTIPWATQSDHPASPDLVAGGEPVEYIESDNGEWIASDRWEKGVLDLPDFELEDGEPLETRACETCGAKQYVHEGVVEPTCDCEIDEELTFPSTQSGQSSRDESRVSFRVEGNVFGSSSPTYSDLSGSIAGGSFGNGKIKVSVDVDEVLPLLVDRLSQHSLRNSFHHT